MALLSTIGHQLVIVLAALCAGTQGTYYPEVVYLNQNCGRLIPLLDPIDVVVKMAPETLLSREADCFLTLDLMVFTDPQRFIKATFMKFSMDPSYYSQDCDIVSIHLYGQHAVLGPNEYCSSSLPSPVHYFLGYRAGSLGFRTGNLNLLQPPDMEVLFSVYYNKDSDNSCPENTFDCGYRGFCVDEELTCNGYDDCGNNRDEIEGCGLTPTTTTPTNTTIPPTMTSGLKPNNTK